MRLSLSIILMNELTITYGSCQNRFLIFDFPYIYYTTICV
nr:MAG TPA_asm: hypothetical protein [Caudoviricetes sp.]